MPSLSISKKVSGRLAPCVPVVIDNRWAIQAVPLTILEKLNSKGAQSDRVNEGNRGAELSVDLVTTHPSLANVISRSILILEGKTLVLFDRNRIFNTHRRYVLLWVAYISL